MRSEYLLYNRIVMDHDFRRLFIANPYGALLQFSIDPSEYDSLLQNARIYGLEEESYRRLASLCRSIKKILPLSYNLIVSHWGNAFFELVLKNYFELCKENAGKSLEILDPFDGYVIGPMIDNLVIKYHSDDEWVYNCMRYEWATWYANRLISGWPPITTTSSFVAGTTLVTANYDLKSLMKEIRRLELSSVCSEIFRWRAIPSPGSFNCLIFPMANKVVEIEIDDSLAKEVNAALTAKDKISIKLSPALQQLGYGKFLL